MSTTVAFWNEGPDCNFSSHVIYRRLSRALPVKGLRPIPRTKAERIIRGLLQGCEQKGNCFAGHIGDAHVDVSLTDQSIFVILPLLSDGLQAVFAKALMDLGVSMYDPLAVPAPSGDHLYDDDYVEISSDPDLGYWVEPSLTTETAQKFGDRLSGGSLDGYGTIAVVVIVPGALVQRFSAGYEPREHIKFFTAFADDDKVLYYQEWWPNDASTCATVISLRAMPKRLKTILSTRFVHRG